MVLPKRTAYFYYEQHKRALYYEKKNHNLKIQLDSSFSIIGEKTFQLTMMDRQLKGEQMLNTSNQIKLQVAHKDYDILETRFKRVRKERDLAIGIISAILLYSFARSR